MKDFSRKQITMLEKTLHDKIAAYEAAHKVAIAYGGDGTVLDIVRQTNGKRPIIPIRNYSCCSTHADFLDKLLDGKLESPLKLTRCPFITFSYNGISDRGISEVTLKNADPTSALRFDLSIDGHPHLKNVISDGLIASTTYGSTGYFKSISRTIFSCDGIGIAFIAPTQGINNLIANLSSNISITIIRETDAFLTADKVSQKVSLKAGDVIEISMADDAVSIFGLSEFHCQQCRALRHSSYEDGQEIQDMYAK